MKKIISGLIVAVVLIMNSLLFSPPAGAINCDRGTKSGWVAIQLQSGWSNAFSQFKVTASYTVDPFYSAQYCWGIAYSQVGTRYPWQSTTRKHVDDTADRVQENAVATMVQLYGFSATIPTYRGAGKVSAVDPDFVWRNMA